jgi:hypothetical protein
VEVERLQGRLRGDLVLLWGRLLARWLGPFFSVVGSQASVGRSSIIDYLPCTCRTKESPHTRRKDEVRRLLGI